tara:strand:+ start:244 stop:768 length:525 start_codon:yes stop_codon:yes gene_type:complete
MSVTIELDFTGHSPAGVGIGYLSTGLHEAKIVEFRHYDESNRLYAYMVTNGIRHRDSFSLSEKAMPFLMAFLISAGVPETKLQGKINFPFDKLTGKAVYFNYTAPTMGANGQPVDGSYAEYRYVTEAYFGQMKKAQAAPAPTDFAVEAKTANGAGNPVSSDDGFDFLLKSPTAE